MIYKLRKFNVLNMALFLGLYGFFIGLIMGIIFIFLPSIGSLPKLGFLSLLIFPFGIAIFMFLFGLIFTLIINLIFKIIKGLELDLDNTPNTPKASIKIPAKTKSKDNKIQVSTTSVPVKKPEAESAIPKTPIKPAI